MYGYCFRNMFFILTKLKSISHYEEMLYHFKPFNKKVSQFCITSFQLKNPVFAQETLTFIGIYQLP